MDQHDISIVIVEDSPMQAMHLRDVLESNNYRIPTVASNGVEALAHIKENPPDLIISDVVMPIMGGYELCKRVKSDPDLKDIPLILLTSLTDPRNVIKGLECGADNFLTKPYEETVLLSRIEYVWVNHDRRKVDAASTDLKILFAGDEFTITADRVQILDLLVSSFEHAVEKNRQLEENISELRTTQQQLKKAKEAAEESNKAKSQFLANMSHDIRTPMNGILGMTSTLMDTPLSNEQQEYLSIIKGSSTSLLSLLNDILDFSKIEAGMLELEEISFSLRDTVETSLMTLALQVHEKGLELCGHILPNVPDHIKGDPNRLRQILINLLGNAVKFTETGDITIRVEIEEQQNNHMLLHFAVKDTGIGIPLSQQKNIFGAFTQADRTITRQFGGTGLGLAISSRLANQMGGKMWVESQSGKGSTFHFTVACDIVPTSDTDFIAEKEDLRGIHVLAVVANETNQQIISDILSMYELNVTVVDSQGAAIAAMQSAQESQPYHCAIVDSAIQGTDPFSLAVTLKEFPGGGCTVLMLLSAVSLTDETKTCIARGIQHHIIKPLRQKDLLEKLAIALGRKTKAEKDAIQTEVIPTDTSQRILRILVAEDNIVNQRVLQAMLKKTGHKLIFARTGKQAVTLFEEKDPDLVFMDIEMPEMDGYEATQGIREFEKSKGTKVPILAMTAHAMKGDMEKCVAAGMDDYISKPIDKARLTDLVKEYENVLEVK